MTLSSTRGWEELEWMLEKKFIVGHDSYFQFTLKFRSKFWDRQQLLTTRINELVEDINCEFSQVNIDQKSLHSWLSFLENLTTQNLTDLKLGTGKEFVLVNNPGEVFRLTISDSHQNPGYTIEVDFKRGKTSMNLLVDTDVTCLTNYHSTLRDLTR